ncbi:MAG: tetratricopeptide repeat protein [Pirellulaceae bacterium]|nr:tetratricopeptide repeat protein [Pirellulaceae bacterium]
MESVDQLQQRATNHTDAGEFQAAIQLLEAAVMMEPYRPDAGFHLALLYHRQSSWEAAATCYERVVSVQPDFTEALNNLGCVLLRLGRHETALGYLERAQVLSPNIAEIHLNIGNVQIQQGRYELALDSYQTALLHRPDYADAFTSLGNVFKEQCKLDEAFEAYLRAMQLKPTDVQCYANLGSILQEQSRFDEALQTYRRALQLKPDAMELIAAVVYLQQLLCQWNDLNTLAQQLIDGVEHPSDRPSLIPPFLMVGLALETTPEQQASCARSWADSLYRYIPRRKHEPVAARIATPEPRLRIGYLSGDFRRHSVAYMIPELFERHCRDRFEIYAYSICPDDGSDIRKRIINGVDVFRDIRALSFRASSELIADDGIDILVDLQGYTTLSRTEIVAYRPAPIQVSYLGYPGTMGADFYDYILADDFVAPLDQAASFNEKLVHLPVSYQVNDRFHGIAAYAPSRVECDLPEDAFVFCSFNNSYKITPNIFDVWMRLLRDVPKSVLWIAGRDELVNTNLVREAKSRGISSDRLRFAKSLPLEEHLARQPLADLFLDSFPYNGHATSSIALRMGVPIVTLAGRSFASRVSGSLLRALGLTELITHSLEEYETRARQLARDPIQFSAIRAKLARNIENAPLFDGAVFASDVEKAYRAMWEGYTRGEAPKSILVSVSK